MKSLFLLILCIVLPAQAETLTQASARFLGVPYILGPEGEGAYDVYDQFPLMRLDAFDCTTFVEVVMAMSGATDSAGHVDLSSLEDRLRRIRYKDGKISYFTRNHFPELDWLPNNEAAGWLTDVTEAVGGTQTAYSEAVIDKKGWFHAHSSDSIRPPRSADETQKLLTQLQSLGDAISPQKARIAYLPSSILISSPEMLKSLPDEGIVNIVRENWNPDGMGTPVIISHQMILIHVNGEPRLRHASPGKGVVEIALVDYLKEWLDSPTIRGINVLKMTH